MLLTDLLTQLADVYVDRAVAYDHLLSPNLLVDLFAGDELAGASCQQLQQGKLLAGQGQLLASDGHRVARCVDTIMALSMVACGAADNGEVTYAIVCKDASNPYMLRMISGFEEACKALGVKSVTKSPETATVDGQIQIVNELIAQGVKGIAIAANDAAALEATIKSATDAGIVVVTLDSDTKGSQMFVNQAGVEQVAQVLVDSILDMTGGEGEFAVLSASSTATNQNAWIAAMDVIIKGNPDKYGKLTWVETVYGDDEAQKSTDEMQNLMTKYPNLEVVCCPTTVVNSEPFS